MYDDDATYCPEDNKLRLYVGRVPRDEYEALRKEGWTSTPKQDCDFVATWTPAREDTALVYAEYIGDEDQSPEDRAADRAERFSEYRDKRRGEAYGHADSFDAGPAVHGHQSRTRAERSARRHDRERLRAVCQWSKAEYWQRRTAGVISHALYVSSDRVRRGRILRLESEQRRFGNMTERWATHYALRLAYEKQMLEASGGMAGDQDILPGGTFGRKLIVKTHKSNATGRVVSVQVKTEQVSGYAYQVRNVAGCEFALARFKVEKFGPEYYQPPTPEGLAELAEIRTAMTAGTKKANTGKPKLVNPTREAAQALQDALNTRAAKQYSGAEPVEVWEMTQAEYSARSKGTYSFCSAYLLARGGKLTTRNWEWGDNHGRVILDIACKVRACSGGTYNARRVIVITDKPQKPLPDWTAQEQPAETEQVQA